MEFTSKRTFSKRVVVVNNILAWAAVFFAIYMTQSEWVAVGAFGLLAAINTWYMEVGHKDLAKLADTEVKKQEIASPTVATTPSIEVNVTKTDTGDVNG